MVLSSASASWIPLTVGAVECSEGMVEVLLYPTCTRSQRKNSQRPNSQVAGLALLKSRIAELRALGLEALCSTGPKSIQGVRILGVGYCGLVLRARWNGKIKALKLRRWDAGRTTLQPEAEALQLANTVRVGPLYRAASQNALVMDEVEGDRFIDWVRTSIPRRYADLGTVHTVLTDLAEAAFRLDQLGLDHGELNCIAGHAIVPWQGQGQTQSQTQEGGRGLGATLIDFSQASTQRRVNNLTALVQGLLVGTSIPKLLGQYFELPERSRTIEYLRAYKQRPGQSQFEAVRSLLILKPRGPI